MRFFLRLLGRLGCLLVTIVLFWISAGRWDLPFAWDITEGVGLGVMLELDVIYSEGTRDHDFGFLHTAVLGVDLFGPVGGYLEYVGNAFFDGSDYEAFASFGLTYELTENAVLDGGALIGLTRAATDVAVFMGITLRF